MKKFLALLIFLNSCGKIDIQKNNEPAWGKVQGEWSLQKIINEDNSITMAESLGYKQDVVIRLTNGTNLSINIFKDKDILTKNTSLSYSDITNEEKEQAFWVLLDNQKYIFISRTVSGSIAELKISDFFTSKQQTLSGKQFVYNYKL